MNGIQRSVPGRPSASMIPQAASMWSSTRAVFLLLVSLSLVLASCAGGATPTPTGSPRSAILIETRLTAADRLATFDTAWQTVNDKYWDPTFGGKDWQAIGDEYRPKLATVQDDATFWLEVLNPMLFELGVSHLVALPAELTSDLDPMTFAAGSLGFDIRLLDDRPVVTRVAQGSPAETAGLRPGFVVTTLDGRTLSDFAALGPPTPPYNERNRRANAIQGMRSGLFGDTGGRIVVEYVDASDRPHHATVQLASRSGGACAELDPTLPPACAEVESRRLSNGIGYVRFSGFLTAALDKVLGAIDDLRDAPALIIDLRGNPGGQFPVRKAIASQLVGEPKLFIRYQHRDGMEEAYLDAVPNAYPGLLVILVDELSASSSEEFAGSLQALGRATIIGSQTPGRCLVMNVAPLPNGAILTYPYGQAQTPDGRVLEDNGVVPDIDVDLNRGELLQGVDAQLQAAIDYLAKRTGH
ncbi:MAG TPA: S41 family peptidase [Candidatus Limnocylindrales bacterium]